MQATPDHAVRGRSALRFLERSAGDPDRPSAQPGYLFGCTPANPHDTLRWMGSSFGTLFRITTFGESHGPALGVVVDGCPARLPISIEAIQAELDRRRPGQSRLVSQRKEADQVEVLSGV